jgi:hypothetical protein
LAEQETTQAGYWNWEPEGKPIRIQLSLDVVDRMLATVIDGFGSVPKRGAEVGGLLLGSRSRSDGRLDVTIDGYLPVKCSHRFGPSFVLSPDDMEEFEAAVHQTGGVVGFYRSHTRDGLSLGTEDLQYCHQLFNNPDDVMLLVKPSAMKVSKAGFFYYQAGEIQDRTDLEFPFRRSELETGEAPARRPLGERRPPPTFEPPVGRPARPGEGPFLQPPFQQQPLDSPDAYPTSIGGGGDPEGATERPVRRGGGGLPSFANQQQQQFPAPTLSANKLRRNWVWFPLSFIFLLLGVLLGFQAAMSFGSGKTSSQDPYALSLGVERRQDDLAVRWDRSNAAIRTASKAILDIQDGRYSKRVELDSTQLQSGSVVYRFSTDAVRFKLEVYPRDHIAISDWVEWKK